MRPHETWCASAYRDVNGGQYMACDCGAQQENAQQLAPQQDGLKKNERREKQPIRWLGRLPDQFCVKCESAPVKAVVLTPKDKRYPTRVFAACLSQECAHIRELDSSAM